MEIVKLNTGLAKSNNQQTPRHMNHLTLHLSSLSKFSTTSHFLEYPDNKTYRVLAIYLGLLSWPNNKSDNEIKFKPRSTHACPHIKIANGSSEFNGSNLLDMDREWVCIRILKFQTTGITGSRFWQICFIHNPLQFLLIVNSVCMLCYLTSRYKLQHMSTYLTFYM